MKAKIVEILKEYKYALSGIKADHTDEPSMNHYAKRIAHLYSAGEECPNCKETGEECACARNKCNKCGKPVGNITFTVCDECWDKEYSAGEEVYVECPFDESSLKLVDWDKGAEQTPKAVKPVTLIDAENIIPQQLNRRDRNIYEAGRGNGFREGKSHAIAIQKKLTRPTVSEDEIGAEILPYLIEFDPYVDWSELLDRLSKAIKELNR